MDERFRTKLAVVLHGEGYTLYSECEPEKVKEQLGGTCLWCKDIDGAEVQLNLREIPMIAIQGLDERT